MRWHTSLNVVCPFLIPHLFGEKFRVIGGNRKTHNGLHISICAKGTNVFLRNSKGNSVADTCNSPLCPVHLCQA